MNPVANEVCHCDGPPHLYSPSWCRKGRRADGSDIDPYFGMHPSPTGGIVSSSSAISARYVAPPTATKKVGLTTKNITDIAAQHGDILSKNAALDIIRQIEDTL